MHGTKLSPLVKANLFMRPRCPSLSFLCSIAFFPGLVCDLWYGHAVLPVSAPSVQKLLKATRLKLRASFCLTQHNVCTLNGVWCSGSSHFKGRREALCGLIKIQVQGSWTINISTPCSGFFFKPLSHMAWFPKSCRKNTSITGDADSGSQSPATLTLTQSYLQGNPPCFDQGLVRIVGTFHLTSK